MKRKIENVNDKENISVNDDDNIVYDAKRQRNVNLKELYPQDLRQFVNGMREDVLDIFSSVKKTFEVLLPFTAVDDIEVGGSDEIDTCIESSAASAASSTSNDKTNNDETNTIKKHNEIKEKNDNQYQNTLRMRCSTLHHQKYKPIPKVSTSNSPPKANQSKGSIVQLKKLKNSSTLISYECCDSTLIIIGNRRMIYVKKNSDNETAVVLWIQPLSQVDSLTIGYTGIPLTLIFVLRDAKQIKVNIPDKNTYSAIITTIQERKEKLIKTNEVTTSTVTFGNVNCTLNGINQSELNHSHSKPISSPVPTPIAVVPPIITSSSLSLAATSSLSSSSSLTPTTTLPAEVRTTSDLPDSLRKFVQMLKHGVPSQAVVLKMQVEKVPQADQDRVLQSASGASSSGAASAAATATTTSASSASSSGVAITGSNKPPPGPKLLNLHWSPMRDQSKTNRSIWGQVPQQESLESEHYEQLRNLFSRKETKPSNSDDEPKLKKTKITGPKFIEFARSNNICIGLAKFRSKGIKIDEICEITRQLKFKSLSIDEWLRVKELLPSDTETKSLKSIVPDAIDTHESEVCLLKLSKISRIRDRLDAIIFFTTLESAADFIMKRLNLLLDVSLRILNSAGFKEILTTILAIGNALNANTYKGSAIGFKISGLQKLSQTKSIDGKSNVIDYLVQVLYSRQSKGDKDANLALLTDQELSPINDARSYNLMDLIKDVRLAKKDYEAATEIYNAIADTLDEDQKTALTEDLKHSNEILGNMELALQSTQSKTEEACQFLGEEAANSNQIFNIISGFLNEFADSKKKYNKSLK